MADSIYIKACNADKTRRYLDDECVDYTLTDIDSECVEVSIEDDSDRHLDEIANIDIG